MFSQVQSQKQQHKILPQQIELLNLFHLNSLELELRIQDELNENPLLEETAFQEDGAADKFSKETVQDFQNWEEYGYDDIPDYKTEYENYFAANQLPDKPLADSVDFREDLKKQCRFTDFPDEKYFILDFLIDSLNESGFLEQDSEALATEISFKKNIWVEPQDIDDMSRFIMNLEPLGVATRNVQEYLMFRLEKMNTKRPDVKMAIQLLKNHYTDLHSCNIEKIKRSLKLEDDEIKIVLHLLATLGNKPVVTAVTSTQVNNSILPDFIVTQDGEQLTVALYRQRSSNLHISQSWVEMVQSAEQDASNAKAAKQYLRSKLSAAQWFLSAIQQRESNMLKVMKAIVELQHEYFLYGDIMMLKPMILKHIADKVGVDISTVSRITCNKYAETPFGTILLKDLFTEGIVNKEGNNISNRVIQTTIEEIISTEDKKTPYTDQQLVSILGTKGYNVARRTVAKYRELLNIPVTQMRALWSNNLSNKTNPE
ncbi:MAG: RNA polymerase factor sigma-54 [Gemmatimonadaceae bacterium]|nr:RNA polymerase factor sigma-54 [Chitinophagaceae bacterium]